MKEGIIILDFYPDFVNLKVEFRSFPIQYPNRYDQRKEMLMQGILDSVAIAEQKDYCLAEIARLQSSLKVLYQSMSQVADNTTGKLLRDRITGISEEIYQIEVVILPIIQAGYSKITPPRPYVEGFPFTDPRPYKGWMLSENFGILSLLAGTAVMLFSFFIFMSSASAPIYVFLVIIGPLILSCITMLSQASLKRKNIIFLRNAGIATERNPYFLKNDPPPEAKTAIEKAKASNLFDEIKVVAPLEAFEKAHLVIDLYIIGKAAGETFLICAYNIGEDIKSAT